MVGTSLVWTGGILLGEGLFLPCLIVALTNAQVLPTDGANCRDLVRALFLANEWTQAQLAQYNEFVECGLKN